MFFAQREGAGNAGRSMRPQPRMQNKKAYEHSHHGHTGLTRHSPRNGFNGFLRALPSDRAFLPLSSADRSTDLMPASGHQDHTTSPSASARFVKHAAASTASRANVRDDRETPLVWARDAGVLEVICPTAKGKYFSQHGWTRCQLICPPGSLQSALPSWPGLSRPSTRFLRNTQPTCRMQRTALAYHAINSLR